MDMILMDEEGNKIQATVKRNLLGDFESLFDEGCIREISNFGVASNTGDYMLVKHACKINFFKSTKLRVLNDFEPAVSVQEYDFPIFMDLLHKKIDMRVAFDIVCEVVTTEPMTITYEHGREKRVMSMQIRDLSGKQISCALWGDFALKLHTYIVENQNSTAPVIMLLRNAKLKDWVGKPQVSNCLFGTKMFINEDVQPILVFKESGSNSNLSPLSSIDLIR